MRGHKNLDEIRQLDPNRDNLRIFYLDAFCEFPFDTVWSLELALCRAFAIPSISGALERAGEYPGDDHADPIISEILEHGYESERGRQAIERLKKLCDHYNISNDETLYMLSIFTFEPIRWNARFGWRRMNRRERLAAFYFWRKVGSYLNITSLPTSYNDFEHWSREYERAHFSYAESNKRMAQATRDTVLRWLVPQPVSPLGAPLLHAMMDGPLLRALGLPEPSARLRHTVVGALKLRSMVQSIMPVYRKPKPESITRRDSRKRAYAASSKQVSSMTT